MSEIPKPASPEDDGAAGGESEEEKKKRLMAELKEDEKSDYLRRELGGRVLDTLSSDELQKLLDGYFAETKKDLIDGFNSDSAREFLASIEKKVEDLPGMSSEDLTKLYEEYKRWAKDRLVNSFNSDSAREFLANREPKAKVEDLSSMSSEDLAKLYEEYERWAKDRLVNSKIFADDGFQKYLRGRGREIKSRNDIDGKPLKTLEGFVASFEKSKPMIDKLKSDGVEFLNAEGVSVDGLYDLSDVELSELYARYEASAEKPDDTNPDGEGGGEDNGAESLGELSLNDIRLIISCLKAYTKERNDLITSFGKLGGSGEWLEKKGITRDSLGRMRNDELKKLKADFEADKKKEAEKPSSSESKRKHRKRAEEASEDVRDEIKKKAKNDSYTTIATNRHARRQIKKFDKLYPAETRWASREGKPVEFDPEDAEKETAIHYTDAEIEESARRYGDESVSMLTDSGLSKGVMEQAHDAISIWNSASSDLRRRMLERPISSDVSIDKEDWLEYSESGDDSSEGEKNARALETLVLLGLVRVPRMEKEEYDKMRRVKLLTEIKNDGDFLTSIGKSADSLDELLDNEDAFTDLRGKYESFKKRQALMEGFNSDSAREFLASREPKVEDLSGMSTEELEGLYGEYEAGAKEALIRSEVFTDDGFREYLRDKGIKSRNDIDNTPLKTLEGYIADFRASRELGEGPEADGSREGQLWTETYKMADEIVKGGGDVGRVTDMLTILTSDAAQDFHASEGRPFILLSDLSESEITKMYDRYMEFTKRREELEKKAHEIADKVIADGGNPEQVTNMLTILTSDKAQEFLRSESIEFGDLIDMPKLTDAYNRYMKTQEFGGGDA